MGLHPATMPPSLQHRAWQCLLPVWPGTLGLPDSRGLPSTLQAASLVQGQRRVLLCWRQAEGLLGTRGGPAAALCAPAQALQEPA